MKKLTRMKLINWHRFNNCTIEFGDSTLLSGENGAGKSTLLDAIQFVIICSTGYFNKAAHENGKRRLTGYIRCKTGKENQPYERTGEISAHVALEFYEESKDKYFIIGAVVDSASEGQETTVRYLMENTRISDDLFLYGNQVKSIAEFRGSNIDIQECFDYFHSVFLEVYTLYVAFVCFHFDPAVVFQAAQNAVSPASAVISLEFFFHQLGRIFLPKIKFQLVYQHFSFHAKGELVFHNGKKAANTFPVHNSVWRG